MSALPREFYARPTLEVARDLLGRHVVRVLDGVELRGRIVETEAYCGVSDTACHAARGITKRTERLFGPPGHAYVYFTYGMHWLLNAVCEPPGHGCGVLVRALEPVGGLEVMRARRPGRPDLELTSGPAKLTRALGIDGAHDGWDLVVGETLWFEAGAPVEGAGRTPRIGIDYAASVDREALWRFTVAHNPHVSRISPLKRPQKAL